MARRWLLLAAIAAAGVAVRLPILLNATYTFNGDEAVNALVIKHLVEGRELTLFPWDATYYGIVEGLLALPFVALLGWVPLAFKLAALTGFVAMLLAVYLLGARAYEPAAGVTAAALLATFSPALVYWSSLASVGYCLIVAWGTLALWQHQRLRERPTPGRAALFGFLLGFGLYIYELFAVYVALFALAAAGAGVRRLSRLTRGEPLVRLPETLAMTLAGAAAFLLGAAPKLWPLATGAAASKRPSYGLADPATLRFNVRLLMHDSVPDFFGVVLDRGAPLLALCGLFFLAANVAAWLWALAGLRGQAGTPAASASRRLLLLLVPVVLLLVVLTPNVRDLNAHRYLLPLLSALPVFAGAALVRLGRRRRSAAICAGAFLLLYPLVPIARSHRHAGLLDEAWWPRRLADPALAVVAHLERQGLHGAYADYWDAYKMTFLAGERLLVAPFDDWDRYPPYTERVNRLPRVAYVLRSSDSVEDPVRVERLHGALARFRDRLASAGAQPLETRLGPYFVFQGPGGARLLPPSRSGLVARLEHPCAHIEPLDPPVEAALTATLRVRARLRNCSDGRWSATGLPLAGGDLRVAAAYRWFHPDGRALAIEPARSLLPGDVEPGAEMEMTLSVATPGDPGAYDLAITLVQENVAWFDQAGGSLSPRMRIAVRGGV